MAQQYDLAEPAYRGEKAKENLPLIYADGR
jgi:hypothetical protein